VAVTVVDGLEVVDVQRDQRELGAAPGGVVELDLQALVERRVVEQAGQRVGAGGERQRSALAVVLARLQEADEGREPQRGEGPSVPARGSGSGEKASPTTA
jgi:ABC-type hemin transport system ATPase subunit